VFVVGCLGDWRRAAAVLFERHSLSGDIAPRRKTGEGVTRAAQPSTPSSWWDGGSIAATLTTKSDDQRMPDKDNAQLILQSVPFRDPSPTITARMQGSSGWAPYNEDAHLIGVAQPIAIQDVRGMDKAQNGKGWSEDGTAYTLDAIESVGTVFQAMQVRRLTPTECERLQGFPDGYTAIPWRNKPAEECPDGPRYKALGNSWAVPVVRWIGERINAVQEIKVAA
jgi:DNA (cytosine-5)-methyltransferase 1